MPSAAIPELLLDDAVFLVSLQCIQDSIEHPFRRPALLREALVGERVPVRIGGEIVQQGNQKIAQVPALADSEVDKQQWWKRWLP